MLLGAIEIDRTPLIQRPAHERSSNFIVRAGLRRGGRTLSQAPCGGVPQSLFSIPQDAVNVSFFSVQGNGYSATVRLRSRAN